MSIKCKLCGKEYKMITTTHLKSHNITVDEYVERYGKNSLTSEEYRKSSSVRNSGKNNPNYGNNWDSCMKRSLSEKRKGYVPWNKGIKMDDSFREKMKENARNREEMYKKGIWKRPVNVFDEEKRKRISEKQKEFARKNPEKMKQRAAKAMQTLRNKGHDFGASMRGRKHSEETKKRLSDHLKKANYIKTKKSIDKISKRINESNLELKNNINDHTYDLVCKKDGTEFTLTRQYFSDSKYTNKICPTCYPRSYSRSKSEIELFDFVTTVVEDEVRNNDRSVLSGKEIDIWIPSKKIGIEYNGLYWHSQCILEDVGKHKHCDFHKQKEVLDQGNTLIVVFEDEFINKKDIVESMIKHRLGKCNKTIYARKCEVRKITSTEANLFLNKNHIQGSGRSNARYGLYDNGQLVSVMTFSNKNISRRLNEWEINRFCSMINTNIIGAAGKLFKRFIKDVNPNSVVSYSDNRWGSGEVYKHIGFSKVSHGTPNYWYFLPNQTKRIHRYSLRKNKNDDPNLTEYENRLKQGYKRVWDCGHAKWIWPKLDK